MNDKKIGWRKGWRYFDCECGHTFWEATRDRFSPSGETCPKCGYDVHPSDNKEDDTLKVDKSGNLVN